MNAVDSLTIDEKIKRYIELRDKKAAFMKKAEVATQPWDHEMHAIQGALHTHMTEAGIQNIRGQAGTAYINVATSVKAEDWDEYLEFVKANDFWHGVERRPSKTAITEFESEHGELPPGISMSAAQVVRFQKSKSRK